MATLSFHSPEQRSNSPEQRSRGRRINRSLVTWTIFPVVLVASHVLAVAAFDAGYGVSLTVATISGIVAVLLFVAERLHPYTTYWRKPQGDIRTDVTHLLFSTMLVPPFVDALFRSLMLIGAAGMASIVGFSVWPHQWPIAIQLGLALLIAEFGQYWWHRSCHEREPMWRFHATHHSSRRLYWLNSCRFHPIDAVAQYTLEVSPLILLGCPGEVLGLFTLSTAVIGMFQHANVDLKLGPLNWVFSMTELHRWHHSCNAREGNSNYGANLILWDLVFGTRFLPADRELEPQRIGIGNMPHFPRDYFGQLASPFRWNHLKRHASRPSERATLGSEDASGRTKNPSSGPSGRRRSKSGLFRISS